MSAAACTSVNEQAAGSRQTAIQGTPSTGPQVPDASSLPFDSFFTRRWNTGNDGTTYEPCLAIRGSALEALGISAGTVSDAAGSDGQTARGCYWEYHPTDEGLWAVSQTVGNSDNLVDYKDKYQDRYWLDDIRIDGRVVGISQSKHLIECLTYVQSGRAGVTTTVIHHRSPRTSITEVCDRAIAFTEATITKMPR
nr:DUF3558 family protein [Gordonia hirsuta]